MIIVKALLCKMSQFILSDDILPNFYSSHLDALEFSLKGDGKEWLWCVDPIDGTTNFASGLPVRIYSIDLQSSPIYYSVKLFTKSYSFILALRCVHRCGVQGASCRRSGL